MYSVVLMLALSGSAEATELGNRCCGCTGYVASCCGARYTRCHGCTGCFGGCHGCHGRVRHSCCGAVAYTCSGCYGSCHGRCHGRRHGCHGYVACCGYTPPACCGTVAPAAPVPPGPTKGPEKMPPAPMPMPKTSSDVSATIVVTLPADARLTVDGNATTSTSARRVLVTPSLEQGEYVYSLRAEVVRNGQTVVQTQNVTVRPGQTTEVPFNFASESVASR